VSKQWQPHETSPKWMRYTFFIASFVLFVVRITHLLHHETKTEAQLKQEKKAR
jgi:uncharacterized membrane protein